MFRIAVRRLAVLNRFGLGLALAVVPTVANADGALATDTTRVAAARGVFAMTCTVAHGPLADDPIVFPDQPGAAHLHEFFGNTTTDAYSTSDTLRDESADTTCQRDENKSAYWVPALYVDNNYVPATFARVYYRTGGLSDPSDIQPFNYYHMMIAGDVMSQAPQDLRIIQWGCVYQDGPEHPTATIPSKCGDDPGESTRLRLRVYFMNCWDGVVDPYEDHTQHMRYAWQNNDGSVEAGDPDEAAEECPSSYPVKLPQIQIGVRWEVAGLDLDNANTSSDIAMGMTGGITAHGDFMNGWDQDELEDLVEYCLQTPRHCSLQDPPLPRPTKG